MKSKNFSPLYRCRVDRIILQTGLADGAVQSTRAAFAATHPQYKSNKIRKSRGCCRGAMVTFNSSGKNFIGRELPQ